MRTKREVERLDGADLDSVYLARGQRGRHAVLDGEDGTLELLIRGGKDVQRSVVLQDQSATALFLDPLDR